MKLFYFKIIFWISTMVIFSVQYLKGTENPSFLDYLYFLIYYFFSLCIITFIENILEDIFIQIKNKSNNKN